MNTPIVSDDAIRSQLLKSPHQQPHSGFALIIALSLMAFVLLLLLSITTLVQVETVNSAQTKDQLSARNNALLGMQLALGKLQTAAGPDRRITSSAAILPGIDPSKQNYTAVWDTDGATPGAVAAPLAWLASVENNNATTPSASTPTDSSWPMLVSERDSGNIEAVYAAPVSLLSATGNTSGQMAWWVGDEGVKAKFNLAESTYLRDPLIDSEKRLGTSARFGIEALEGFETAYDYTTDQFVANLRKTISAEQGSILDSALSAPLEDHFHDISFHSRGLLTNTRDGGLKQDLTYYFEGGLSGSPLVDTDPISTGGTAAMDRITWGQLKSFYNLADDLDTSTDTMVTRPQEETEAGVYPILTVLNLNYGFTMSSNYDGTDPAVPADRIYNVQPHIRPWFVLANPYNTKLTVSNYRIRIDAETDAGLRVSYDHDNDWQTSSIGIVDISYENVLNNMIFVVPELTLEPGEALYYSLKNANDAAYGYTYVSASSSGHGGRYALYPATDIAAATPRQFVFEAVNDGGQRSIRVGESVQITGDIIENGTRIRKMHTMIDDSGLYSLRTYAGSSATLLDNEKLLQDIGLIRSDGNRAQIKDQGGWNIDDLPNDLFDPAKNEVGNNYFSRENSPEVAATTFVLNSAINIHTETIDGDRWGYHDFDGWATDYNIRAPRMSRHKDAANGSGSKVISRPTAYAVVDLQDGQKFSELKREAGLTSSIRPSFKWAAGYSTHYSQVMNAIFFDIPRVDDVTLQPSIASLAQLQHFNPGGWTENHLDTSISIDTDAELNMLGYAPSYAIGNSYATPMIPRDSTTRMDTASNTTFSDVSYLLNEALFDKYFFSTIPQDSTFDIDYGMLPNKRLAPIDDTVADATVRNSGTAAAENLLVDGAFNVNSTSVDAWYALLNSFRGFDFGDKTSGQGIFPRSLDQSPEFVDGTVDGTTSDAWAGWRHLEDDSALPLEDRKLYQLAEAIVEEVKARGPFVSMSDFVNRRLVSNSVSKAEARTGLSGALQAALDRTVNNEFDSTYNVDTDSLIRNHEKSIVDFEQVGSGTIFDTDGTTVIANATSASSMPGWVLQADLLQALAPALTVRSDTFTIRSYGNVLHPLTGKIAAEAYVEAIVQRMPDYVEALVQEPTDLTTLSPINQLAGRKFAIIDIRFLDQSEL